MLVFKKLIAFYLLLFCFVSEMSAKHRSHNFHKARHSVDFMSTRNTFQIESYVNFEANNGQLTTAHPSVLLRYGIIDKLELRLNMDCSSINDVTTYTAKVGFSPIQPGFKVQFNKHQLHIPSFGLIGSITIPKVASANFAQTYWAPSFQLTAEQDLDKKSKYSLEYTLGLAWDASTFQRIYSVSINTEIDVTDRNTFYADVYLFKPQNDPFDIRADIGINHDILPNLQFDLSSGVGFTNAAPEFFLNVGFIFSYNKWKRHTAIPLVSKRKL